VSFVKGLKNKRKAFVNTAQYSTLDSENKPLYPAPNIIQNISGSDKVASTMPGFQPGASKLTGEKHGLKDISAPVRKTKDIGPYGAPKGAVSDVGTSITRPFAKAIGQFGERHRFGLTRIKRGF